MKTLSNELVVCFDVDDTLIVYECPTHQTEADSIEVTSVAGHNIKVWKHNSHIKLLKTMKARGRLVIVWSHGGYDWARDVVETLDLEDYVDYTMTKPNVVVDDCSDVGSILGGVIYLNRGKYLGG